jgi:endonuclease YncB( thermonuclease family)
MPARASPRACVIALACLLPILAFRGAAAADLPLGLPAALEEGGSGAVVAVVDGDTLMLDDGRQVRLVGIQAPKLPLGREGFETWPLAETAKAALEDLALGREVRLGHGGRQIDRHGRALAHLYRVDGSPGGLWLQGELLARGLARVYSFADNRALVAEMLALEAAARAAGRGIWADPWYRVRDPEDLVQGLADARDSFQIVEGRVADAAVVRKRGYLNFGNDWKSDFTVSIDPAALRLFEAAGLPLDGLEGRRIRVRGWVKSLNGPMIDATHPEQIEVLAE